MSFFSRLEARVAAVDSLLCVGLDPHFTDLPSPSVEAARDFCLRLIEATHPVAAAFKPNSAFFEAFGAQGFSLLKEVVSAVPEGIPVILDAKRGDIASSAEGYARAAFTALGADALTISPYLGYDSIQPFIADPHKGAFLLCKTSNPGAADLQDLALAGQYGIASGHGDLKLFEQVALLAQGWNQQDNLGLVVGATQPEALRQVRSLAPRLWILAPGVGTQGGDLQIALRAGLRSDGSGLLLPVSRLISRADNPAKAAEALRNQINEQRKIFLAMADQPNPQLQLVQQDKIAGLADGLLEAGCIKFGQFTLKSGRISPIYIDLRQLVSFPRLLEQVAAAYLGILSSLTFDRMAGLPYAALPIASVISILGGIPLIYPRKEVKEYGTKAEIEGIYKSGEKIVVIDDLATTGGSKFEAIEKLSAAGLQVKDIVVLIDRQSGAAESLAAAGFQLHAVATLSQLLDHYEHSSKIDAANILAARKFLSETS